MTCYITLAIYSDVMILLQANINVLKKINHPSLYIFSQLLSEWLQSSDPASS